MTIIGTNSLFRAGMTGVKAAETSLATTSHNIANAATPGYSRQRVELAAERPILTKDGYVGTGVRVAEIRRTYDEYLNRELLSDTSTAAEQRVHYELAQRLDGLLSDEASGLAPALQGFFDALEQAASSPGSVSARQVLVEQTDRLAERFRLLDSQLQQTQADVAGRISTTVEEVNALAQQIAQLNQAIIEANSQGATPNDLLDQRDQLVRDLSERIGVKTLEQGNGALDLSIGSGQPLVVGEEAQRLAVGSPREDSSAKRVLLLGPGKSTVDITDRVNGGRLGGLIAFDQGLLADARRELDQIALGVAEGMNGQHRQGMDANGRLGADLFTAVNAETLRQARALGDGGNQGTARLEVWVDAVAGLQGRDYSLTYDGAEYQLAGADNGELIASFDVLPQQLEDAGITITLAGGSMAAGDRFTIRPGAGAARAMRPVLTEAQDLALASPLRAEVSADNLGDAELGSLSITNAIGVGLDPPITLTYQGAAGRFEISDPPGGTLDYDPAADSGVPLTLSVGGLGDLTFSLSGTPVDSDRLSIASNTGASGDNSNALALAALRDAPILFGGAATLAQGYERTVSGVGSRTHALGLAADASDAILSRTEDARAAVSGVNLDEEVAALMRYQQAYEASARVIQVANEVFATLLRATGG
ncbi:flagellar hook-associated protein FlgK [Thioflavicoccus mobilis 8321]|uniref:Flagellar hook-associated protein 1 n=1 Tax=Thioflavicoccus mobilis 8321 TaxID=765912 RepID=L0H1P8_9GAMM|nr:flagellar hook-associated protein FlgK [Thioflavicoccus mobilis]AGA92156.1 flagellar hook-associated protein FlgK [Thioflavicoccus mobilis 8321]